MIRMMMAAVAVLALMATATGYAARWQMVGLLDLVDRFTPGPAGKRIATAVRYASDDPIQLVDVYAPQDAVPSDKRPVIIWFHGGGWHHGGRDVYGFAGHAFASQGFVTVVVGYRLGEAGKFPAFMQDAAAAVRWSHANIARYGGDPDRLVLAGHSAGAHMVELVALDQRWLGEMSQPGGAIKGVIGLAGPADFLPFTPGESPDRAMGHVRPIEQTQPIHFARADAPPLWLAHGDADTTVRIGNSERLAAAVIDAGGQAEVKRYAGIDHSGTVTPLSLFYRDTIPLLADSVAFARAVTD